MARAQVYDDWLEMIRRDTIEQHERANPADLERRRQKVQEELIAIKERIIPRLKVMAEWPLSYEKEKRGGKVVHIHPARWTFGTLARIIEVLDETPERVDLRHFNFDELTNEQLDRIIAGEDPWRVIQDGWRKDDDGPELRAVPSGAGGRVLVSWERLTERESEGRSRWGS